MISRQELTILVEKYKREGLSPRRIKERIRNLYEELKLNNEMYKYMEVAIKA